ncbi:NF-kappa-B inhibitor zeta isoform X1 [Silurus asotus]|uniref:NF-kappa-B inhibitor zeta isoform X1 n=1 Tax=Silurus asotus TaxID=30991 RepID=A0AAD5FV37_SILAS|nr:NF-kappa-B inhibitor zeta isoform X1 [Silurus asotus]
MIIDRVCEGYSAYVDTDADVMTSPVNLWSFYGCSSPGTEAGHLSPWKACGDAEDSGSCAGSPQRPDSSFTGVYVEAQDGSRQANARYQGVRVKNTVKELILQRRHNEVLPNKNENDFPAITTLLQNGKRSAENASPNCITKRPATEHNNVLSPYLLNESMPKEPNICEGLGDMFSNTGLSIESVTVQGSEISICHPAQDTQEALPTLYSTTSSPLYSSCQAPQMTESPYTSPFQCLSPQQGFGPSGNTVPQISFFQWQIQQEEKKLAGLSPLDLISRDGDGDTFLHIAVAQGRRALAYVLARKMYDIGMLDVKEHNNQSAFQVSVAANQHLIAQDLLSIGATVNTTDCWGRSPLHVCAEKGHALILQAIHKAVQNNGLKVNVEAVNYDGLTALHMAVLTHNAVVQDLSHVSEPQSPQTAALMQKRKQLGECISTLLLMGASYGTKDRKSGRTTLHMAAEEANVELLRLFLDQPDSLSVINAKAYNGNTALHMAAAQNGRQAQAHAVQLLMRRGADPSAKNLENEQPVQLVPEGSVGEQVRRILKGRGPQVRSCMLEHIKVGSVELFGSYGDTGHYSTTVTMLTVSMMSSKPD